MNLEQYTKDIIKNLIKSKRLKVKEIECKKCGLVAKPSMMFKINNNGFKASCSKCGAYYGFLKHSEIEVLDIK